MKLDMLYFPWFMVSIINFFIIFQRIKVTSLKFPGSSFLSFLKTGVMLPFLQSSRTSPS